MSYIAYIDKAALIIKDPAFTIKQFGRYNFVKIKYASTLIIYHAKRNGINILVTTFIGYASRFALNRIEVVNVKQFFELENLRSDPIEQLESSS